MLSAQKQREYDQRKYERRLLEANLLKICDQQARRVCGAGYAWHGDDAAGEAMLSALKAARTGASLATITAAARNGAADYLRQAGGRSRNTRSGVTRTGYKLAVIQTRPLYLLGTDGSEYERPENRHEEPAYSQIDGRDWVEAALAGLPARQAGVMRRHLAGDTDLAIAVDMGVSDTRVFQLRRQAVVRLRKAMQAGEI